MLKEICKNIKLIVLDVDGVLTPGDIIYGKNGEELKVFNVHDGMGITLAKNIGLKVAAITGRECGAVLKRLNELNFDVIIQDCTHKLNGFNKIKSKLNLEDNEIAYIGDDIVDIPIMKKVALPLTVADSFPEIKCISKFTSSKNGGHGAVRELIDMILKYQKNKESAIRKTLLSFGYLEEEL